MIDQPIERVSARRLVVEVITSAVNLALYQTTIEDYQTVVFGNTFSNPRGYLANAEEVRVRGFELDANGNIGDALSLRAALVYADGEYVSFRNAPPPLELTGGPSSIDASGGALPGLSKWAASIGGEHRARLSLLGSSGELFTGVDAYYRDDFSSSPTPSEHLNIDGYSLLNLRVGFRVGDVSARALRTFFLLSSTTFSSIEIIVLLSWVDEPVF